MHFFRKGRRASGRRGFGVARREVRPGTDQIRTMRNAFDSDCDGYPDHGDHRHDDVLAR